MQPRKPRITPFASFGFYDFRRRTGSSPDPLNYSYARDNREHDAANSPTRPRSARSRNVFFEIGDLAERVYTYAIPLLPHFPPISNEHAKK